MTPAKFCSVPWRLSPEAVEPSVDNLLDNFPGPRPSRLRDSCTIFVLIFSENRAGLGVGRRDWRKPGCSQPLWNESPASCGKPVRTCLHTAPCAGSTRLVTFYPGRRGAPAYTSKTLLVEVPMSSYSVEQIRTVALVGH